MGILEMCPLAVMDMEGCIEFDSLGVDGQRSLYNGDLSYEFARCCPWLLGMSVLSTFLL